MFALFAYATYYPVGGAHDFQGWFASQEDALEGIKTMYKEGRYWDRYDLAEMGAAMTITYGWTSDEIEKLIERDERKAREEAEREAVYGDDMELDEGD